MSKNRKKLVHLMQSKLHSNEDLNGDQIVYYTKKIEAMLKVFDDENGKPRVIKREINKILKEL